jgi:hypothetical protein
MTSRWRQNHRNSAAPILRHRVAAVPAQARFAPTSHVCDHELRQLRRSKCHRGPHWTLMELHRARHSVTNRHSAPDAYLSSFLLDIRPDRLVPSLCGFESSSSRDANNVHRRQMHDTPMRRADGDATTSRSARLPCPAVDRGAARTGIAYAAAQTRIAPRCNILHECFKNDDAGRNLLVRNKRAGPSPATSIRSAR